MLRTSQDHSRGRTSCRCSHSQRDLHKIKKYTHSNENKHLVRSVRGRRLGACRHPFAGAMSPSRRPPAAERRRRPRFVLVWGPRAVLRPLTLGIPKGGGILSQAPRGPPPESRFGRKLLQRFAKVLIGTTMMAMVHNIRRIGGHQNGVWWPVRPCLKRGYLW